MNVSDRAPTSEYGLLRRAQSAKDAGAQRLIDSATATGAAEVEAPPAKPKQVPPKVGSTLEVVA